MNDELYSLLISVSGVDGVKIDREDGHVKSITVLLVQHLPGDELVELVIEGQNNAGLRVSKRVITEEELG